MSGTSGRAGTSDTNADSDDNAPQPRFTVAAVAARLGLPTATLRSWNQRYGVGPVRHLRGRHRLYSEADIAVVQHMQALMERGASARSAAQAAMETTQPAHGDAKALLDAVSTFDVVAAGRVLDSHLHHYGVLETWEALARPVFRAVENQQARGERCIDVEHLLSWMVARCLHRLPIAVGDGQSSVVLACTGNETHTLSLEALRAALAERDVGAVMLGTTVPGDVLLDAVARAAPPVKVVLWAQTRDTADLYAVAAVRATGAQTLVGGPGWAGAALPGPVVYLRSLRDAVERLTS